MLQKDLLMQWRGIRRNIELGLEIQGVSAAKRQVVVKDLREWCHLKGFADHLGLHEMFSSEG